jgi:XTP/dITP diphosphohydrolase
MNYLRFVSSNRYKAREVTKFLAPLAVGIVHVEKKIEEIQTLEMDHLVKDKTWQAFLDVRRPLLVEHTGLYLAGFDKFPGGLAQLFWTAAGARQVCERFGGGTSSAVRAVSVIGYCDGRRIHLFTGELGGTIAPEPRGSLDVPWDCVFIPDGQTETLAELGERKQEISMRRLALDALAAHLVRVGH